MFKRFHARVSCANCKMTKSNADAKTLPNPAEATHGRELVHQWAINLILARQYDVGAGTIMLGDDPYPTIR